MDRTHERGDCPSYQGRLGGRREGVGGVDRSMAPPRHTHDSSSQCTASAEAKDQLLSVHSLCRDQGPAPLSTQPLPRPRTSGVWSSDLSPTQMYAWRRANVGCSRSCRSGNLAPRAGAVTGPLPVACTVAPIGLRRSCGLPVSCAPNSVALEGGLSVLFGCKSVVYALHMKSVIVDQGWIIHGRA